MFGSRGAVGLTLACAHSLTAIDSHSSSRWHSCFAPEYEFLSAHLHKRITARLNKNTHHSNSTWNVRFLWKKQKQTQPWVQKRVHSTQECDWGRGKLFTGVLIVDLLWGFPSRQTLGFIQQLCVRQSLQFRLSVQSWYHSGQTHTHTHMLPEEDTIRLPVSNNRACWKQLHLSSYSSQSCSTQATAFPLTAESGRLSHSCFSFTHYPLIVFCINSKLS